MSGALGTAKQLWENQAEEAGLRAEGAFRILQKQRQVGTE